MEGWARFHRKIFEWEWYTDANTFRLFFHLVLIANYSDARWRGKEIKRGQHITSINKLSLALNLTEKQIRTAMDKLKKTNEITTVGSNKNTLVTIVNYDVYQERHDTKGEQKGEQKSNERQTKGDKQEDKELKNDNKYKEVFDYYLTLNLIKHKKYTNEMTKAMKHAESNLGIDTEEMKVMLKRHEQKVIATKSNGQYKTWPRALAVFFGQKKVNSTVLICSDYLDGNYIEVAPPAERIQPKKEGRIKL